MLARLIELLLLRILNGIRRTAGRSRRKPDPTVPEGHVLIGHEIAGISSLGGPYQEPRAVTLAPGDRRRHLYAIGGTGSGKTNLLLRLIESDIECGRSFCVIDLRGDLVDRILPRLTTAKTPALKEGGLLLMDLRDRRNVVPFNPLSGEGESCHRALHLLSVIKRHSDSWGVQLEETLRNCLLALAETGWSLLEIEPLLCDARFRSSVLDGVSDRSVRTFFERYGDLSEDKQVTWRLPVLNKVTPLLAIPELRLMLGQRDSSFSFRRLLDERPGSVLLVSLAVDRLHEAAHLVGGLLVSAFQSAVMSRVDQPEAERVPVFLYVDEFETMATDRFEAIVAEGRRFALGLCLSHQNLGQVPANLRNVLRNNVQTQLFFQTGAPDAAELAREIVSADSREDLRMSLISQEVGEAFLVRRGKPSVRVRLLRCPDPEPSPESVSALRAAALRAYARPREDLEREMAERERLLDSADGPAPAGRPAYEVRYDKETRFRPGIAK